MSFAATTLGASDGASIVVQAVISSLFLRFARFYFSSEDVINKLTMFKFIFLQLQISLDVSNLNMSCAVLDMFQRLTRISRFYVDFLM